jgi:hypothetical protein
MFRIEEKLEFKSDNSSTMTNNIPDPIARGIFVDRRQRFKKVIIHRGVRGFYVRREVFIFYYKPFLLCHLCALCGAKKYSAIFRQDFTFWQPYFQMKKPYLHPGKVLFS